MAIASSRSSSTSSTRGWKVANVAIYLVVLVINALGGSGKLSGESIGVIANRSSSYFLPADFIFGIWSLIYLGLTALTVYQALPGERASDAARRMGPWWCITSVLNVAWVTLFSFSRFGAALAVMVVLLAALIALNEHVLPLRGQLGLAGRLSVVYPIGIYLAWISVALIANTFQYAHIVGFSGFGISENAWSASMMVVATLLGWVMTRTKGVWAYPVVVAWAIWGIGVRHADVALVGSTARALVPLGVAMGAVALWRWTRSAPREVRV